MQPQQSGAPPPPQSNYDFILNPSAAPKKSPLHADSKAMRLLIVIGGLFALAIIAAIVISLLGKSGGAFNKAAMLSVAQDQTEITRVTSLGSENGVTQRVKNFSITAQLGLQTDQQALISFLSKNGYKINSKQLLLKQDNKTDISLQSAQSSSTFDTTYTTVMQRLLQTYQSDLKAAYSGASEKSKAVLNSNYDDAELLLLQLNSK